MKHIGKYFLFVILFVILLQCCINNKSEQNSSSKQISVLSFNILQGGHDANNVGFPNSRFGGSRFDDLVNIIKKVNPDIIGIQEDTDTDSLLILLGQGWNRCNNIYSKFKLTPLESSGKMVHSCWVYLPDGDSLVFVNTHWWPLGGGTNLIQDKLLKGDIPNDWKDFEKEIVDATKIGANGPRGYNATINMIHPYLKANAKVIVVGDFNESSHLDWTERYAKEGKDRWVKNPTQVPLKIPIEWPGSKALENIGLSDSYRVVHPDEVSEPGITWTPPYLDGTQGRRDYSNQILDRLDRIYFNASRLKCTTSSVVTGFEGNGEIKLDCDWPSDHWAVNSIFICK